MKACKNCGIDISHKMAKAKFCSRQCKYKFRSKYDETLIRKCKECDVDISHRGRKAIFCSRTCLNRDHDKKPYRIANQNIRKKPYSKFKKSFCEFCGFVAIHSCQLDVDHIDGNHKNNNVENLQTLCANCHRLKTQLQKDYTHKG